MSDKNDDDHENDGHDDEYVARPSTVSEGFNRGDPRLEEGEPESHLGVDCYSLWSKQRTKAEGGGGGHFVPKVKFKKVSSF